MSVRTSGLVARHLLQWPHDRPDEETKDEEAQAVAAYPTRSIASKAVLGVQGEVNTASAGGLKSLELLSPVE